METILYIKKKIDWTTGSAYIKSSPKLVVSVEYRYHSCYIQNMYYFYNEFAYEHYQNNYNSRQCMAYIRCPNYMLLLNILLCDIDITICNMHSLFGY